MMPSLGVGNLAARGAMGSAAGAVGPGTAGSAANAGAFDAVMASEMLPGRHSDDSLSDRRSLPAAAQEVVESDPAAGGDDGSGVGVAGTVLAACGDNVQPNLVVGTGAGSSAVSAGSARNGLETNVRRAISALTGAGAGHADVPAPSMGSGAGGAPVFPAGPTTPATPGASTALSALPTPTTPTTDAGAPSSARLDALPPNVPGDRPDAQRAPGSGARAQGALPTGAIVLGPGNAGLAVSGEPESGVAAAGPEAVSSARFDALPPNMPGDRPVAQRTPGSGTRAQGAVLTGMPAGRVWAGAASADASVPGSGNVGPAAAGLGTESVAVPVITPRNGTAAEPLGFAAHGLTGGPDLEGGTGLTGGPGLEGGTGLTGGPGLAGASAALPSTLATALATGTSLTTAPANDELASARFDALLPAMPGERHAAQRTLEPGTSHGAVPGGAVPGGASAPGSGNIGSAATGPGAGVVAVPVIVPTKGTLPESLGAATGGSAGGTDSSTAPAAQPTTLATGTSIAKTPATAPATNAITSAHFDASMPNMPGERHGAQGTPEPGTSQGTATVQTSKTTPATVPLQPALSFQPLGEANPNPSSPAGTNPAQPFAVSALDAAALSAAASHTAAALSAAASHTAATQAAATPGSATPGSATPTGSSTQPQAPLAPQLSAPLFSLASARPGEHVMTLRVTPEDLGPLTVRAHIDATGVRIELFAPGDAGRDAVRHILPELRRGLEDTGASLSLSSHNSPADSGQGSAAGQGNSANGSGTHGNGARNAEQQARSSGGEPGNAAEDQPQRRRQLPPDVVPDPGNPNRLDILV